MRILLDTHVSIAIVERDYERFGAEISGVLQTGGVFFASVARLWEIMIK